MVTEGAFNIRVGGLVQIDYLGVATENHLARRLDQASASMMAGNFQAGTPLLDESTLLLRTARLSAAGNVGSPRLGYFVEVDAAQGTLALLECRVRAELGQRATLNVGQMRVPYSRSWAIREGLLVFPERSIATEQFRYDYDIGISIDALLMANRLALIVGGYNGGGRTLAHNDNLDPMLVLRIEGRPVGPHAMTSIEGIQDGTGRLALVIGGGVVADYVPVPPAYGFLSGSPQAPRQLVTDVNQDGLPDGVTAVSAELDVKVTGRQFAAEVEGYYRHEWWRDIPALQPVSPTVFGPRTDFWGALAQVFGSFADDRITGGIRGSLTQLSPLSPGWQRYPTRVCVAPRGDEYFCSLPYAGKRAELSGVVVYRVIPGTLQLSAMYSFLKWGATNGEAPADGREQRFVARLQLSL
jgi:hypothetical protein